MIGFTGNITIDSWQQPFISQQLDGSSSIQMNDSAGDSAGASPKEKTPKNNSKKLTPDKPTPLNSNVQRYARAAGITYLNYVDHLICIPGSFVRPHNGMTSKYDVYLPYTEKAGALLSYFTRDTGLYGYSYSKWFSTPDNIMINHLELKNQLYCMFSDESIDLLNLDEHSSKRALYYYDYLLTVGHLMYEQDKRTFMLGEFLSFPGVHFKKRTGGKIEVACALNEYKMWNLLNTLNIHEYFQDFYAPVNGYKEFTDKSIQNHLAIDNYSKGVEFINTFFSWL